MSETSRAELMYLSDISNHMVGAQSSKSNIRIVQDCLLGAYLMTKTCDEIDRADFQQMCMSIDKLDLDYLKIKLEDIAAVYKKFNVDVPLYSGKSLFSLILPRDFIYESEKMGVCIYGGVLYKGAITKADLGSGDSSIIRLLHKEYSPEVSIGFVNNVQFIANAFILYHGFSVGMVDCINHETHEIQRAVTKAMVEAEGYELNTKDPFVRESKVTMALGKARDVGMRIAKGSMGNTNRFVDTVTSGSKGDYFNIAQIMGVLGQQTISASRIAFGLSKNKRTLPHYALSIENKEEEYESRGFIRNSFIHGLNPKEFWFHASAAREGITDKKLVSVTASYHSSYTSLLGWINSVMTCLRYNLLVVM
jgi:DNA-directed RNA polymerase beta' subunit